MFVDIHMQVLYIYIYILSIYRYIHIIFEDNHAWVEAEGGHQMCNQTQQTWVNSGGRLLLRDRRDGPQTGDAAIRIS